MEIYGFDDLRNATVLSPSDILNAFTEYESDYKTFVEEWNNAFDEMTEEEWEDSEFFQFDDADDYALDTTCEYNSITVEFYEALKEVESDLWDVNHRGEQLIAENHFEAYIEELIKDAYITSEMAEQLNSGSWPWNHISIDYADAADETKQDYTTIEIGGIEFLTRA